MPKLKMQPWFRVVAKSNGKMLVQTLSVQLAMPFVSFVSLSQFLKIAPPSGHQEVHDVAVDRQPSPADSHLRNSPVACPLA